MLKNMTADRLIDLYAAPTVAAAAVIGDALGWERLTEADTEEWRRHFLAYNMGTVDHVGWRRETASGRESLSFWIATGPNAHKACSYSATASNAMLEGLTARLGPPDTLDKNEDIQMTTAWWTVGAVDYALTQIGTTSTVSVGPRGG